MDSKIIIDSFSYVAKEKGIDLSDPNLTTTQLQSITPYNILAKASRTGFVFVVTIEFNCGDLR